MKSDARPISAMISPGPGFRVASVQSAAEAEELFKHLSDFSTADIADALNRLYTIDSAITSIAGKRVLGRACTVRLFPGDNLMLHKALDIAQPGNVIVVDSSRNYATSVLGSLITAKAKHRKLAGFVIDGLVRDGEELHEIGLPIFARGTSPSGPLHRGPGEINYPIQCGGIVVRPNDIVVGDCDGVVVVPDEWAQSLVDQLAMRKTAMGQYLENVRKGNFDNSWVDTELNKLGLSSKPE